MIVLRAFAAARVALLDLHIELLSLWLARARVTRGGRCARALRGRVRQLAVLAYDVVNERGLDDAGNMEQQRESAREEPDP
ncbi:MAG: hypothetical protein L6Q76_32540 [Polyangiaceae bacterium]|nr:hypothetical protein [Polyangiaceae bacterium]